MRKKLQIFISSTYEDLKEERQLAVEAVLRAGHIPAGMELFAAGSETQLEIIKRWIEDSDAYMLILAGRYGSIEPSSGLSYVEVEYRYALELGKPVFAVFASDTYLDGRVKVLGKTVLELDNPKLFKEFKNLVLSKICRKFDDTKDITVSVLESILDLQNRFELNGWVRASDVPNVNEVLTQLTEIKNENDELQDRLKVYESAQLDKIGEYSFEELVKVLSSIEIEVPANVSHNGKAFKGTVLSLTMSNREMIARGVTNWLKSPDDESFIFYNVMPHLRIYDLAQTIKVDGVAWNRFQTTKLGNKFIALYFLKYTQKASSAFKKTLIKRAGAAPKPTEGKSASANS